MVKCSQIIESVIVEVMDDYSQSSDLKTQYKKLFDNIIINNFLDTDIKRVIESVTIEEED